VVALALAAPACGPRLMKLPSGPGTVAPDTGAVLAEATAACRDIRSLTAEIGVTGSVGGQRVRVRLVGGFAPPSVRLEAAAPFGAPLFIFVASDGDATLLLPRDGRVVEHGQPADLLAAIAGVPLGPSDLARTLALSQLETNVELKPEVFRVDIPNDAQRITTEELRRSGPLGATKTDGR